MNDTITNLIADIRKWEKNAKTNSADPKLAEACSALCPVLDSIATRLEQLIKDGFYVAPEAVRKFAEEQAKKDAGLSFEDAPNLNEVLRNPPFKGGGGAEEEARERFGKFLSIPALGIQFRRSSSPRGATISTATSTSCAWSATETRRTAAGARRLRTTDTPSSSSARRAARTASNSHSRP